MRSSYRQALAECVANLDSSKSPRGMEGLIQLSISKALPGSRMEVPLSEIGAVSVNGNASGRIDIVHETHGIELKVVRMPRIGSSGSNALYDVGQLTADYWRLWKAKGLTSGELLILVYGPLIPELKTVAPICRELHNRLYVDFQTSKQFFELREQCREEGRIRQISAAKEMGVNRPCRKPIWKAHVIGKFALVSVPVDRR